MRTLPLQGSYSLAQSAGFLCGFTPASGTSALDADGRLTLGFLADGTLAPVAVRVAQGARSVCIEVEGAEAAVVAPQVARILSLDHDARGLAQVAANDRVVAQALAERPGFRPVCFPSAYEAAVWGILAQRVPMRVASALRRKLAEQTETVAVGFGQRFSPAPSPRALLALASCPGVPDEKLARLHAIAVAALEGQLDTAALRALPSDEALARLRELRGVGSWTAELVLLRGCGVRDALALSEPRVLDAIASAYGLRRTPSVVEAHRIADGWRPYRMWISVLLVSRAWRAPPPRALTHVGARLTALHVERPFRGGDCGRG